MHILLEDDSITISHDFENKILYCIWRGFQSSATIRPNGDLILRYVKEKKITKILNDNTYVMGHWSDSTEWTQKVWFPEIWRAGLEKFAWVYPEDYFAKISVKAIQVDSRVVFFQTVREAEAWLII